ncbi:hypothetical protein SAMN05216436_11855 [bacterium A37T11]|nr:hypothetical protein SAMN05216436_11855 [bacterium A37T11]
MDNQNYTTSIISVNYNQAEMTVCFLHSLKKYASHDNLEVIVVDNGSKCDECLKFAEAYPGLIYIRSDENLGFAGGNNLGISRASGKYLLLLNNDTEITEGFVKSMCKEMEKCPEIGLLSPLILYFDQKQTIQYAGYTAMNYFTGRNKGIAFRESDLGQFNNTTYEVGFCHGAAMMCRRSDLERVGVMDERYFLYYEELDWCERFRRAGKKIVFTGKAKIYHKESMSVGKESPLKSYFMTRNRWLYIRRNSSLLSRLMFSLYYLCLVFPIMQFNYARRKRYDLSLAAWKGIYWNLLHKSNSKDLG